MIAPSVGRIVWFRPGANTGTMTARGDQPLAAQVVYVWNDRLVNLLVTDHIGTTHALSSVQLVQEGDERPAGGAYAEWMPYQTGQAAKHAAAAPASPGVALPPPPPPPVVVAAPVAAPPASKPKGKRGK